MSEPCGCQYHAAITSFVKVTSQLARVRALCDRYDAQGQDIPVADVRAELKKGES